MVQKVIMRDQLMMLLRG